MYIRSITNSIDGATTTSILLEIAQLVLTCSFSFPDQVAAKMASNNVDSGYDHYRTSSVFDAATAAAANSSESDTESNSYASSPKSELPKRNKRKNFKPRCSNVAYPPEQEPGAGGRLAAAEFANNNNSLKNVRRRKTTATRKLVVDSRFSPMDLSKTNDTDSESEENATTDDLENDGSETDAKIPSSFSIHNLSKPHVSPPTSGTGLSQGQVIEMREYAMNTMRELLGIYGLTSEVAESISRQLPIAAFSSGELS